MQRNPKPYVRMLLGKGRHTEKLACNSRNISEYPKAKITTELLPLGQGIRSESPSRGSLGTLGALRTWPENLGGSQMLACRLPRGQKVGEIEPR